ncbi:MAG: RNA 2',3'-cyclic phosphodiesterase, partial [Candidatus Moranbacteria bacterium]|nr:RNA 2',3'-cyclic phosphodiesterase [Candidatus Moranbacteria bacterium]
PRSPAGIDKALQKYRDFSTGVFAVRELILFQSNLTPQGALYTRLATFPLEG